MSVLSLKPCKNLFATLKIKIGIYNMTIGPFRVGPPTHAPASSPPTLALFPPHACMLPPAKGPYYMLLNTVYLLLSLMCSSAS